MLTRTMFDSEESFRKAKAEAAQQPEILTQEERNAVRAAIRGMMADMTRAIYMPGLSNETKQFAESKAKYLASAFSKLEQMKVL